MSSSNNIQNKKCEAITNSVQGEYVKQRNEIKQLSLLEPHQSYEQVIKCADIDSFEIEAFKVKDFECLTKILKIFQQAFKSQIRKPFQAFNAIYEQKLQKKESLMRSIELKQLQNSKLMSDLKNIKEGTFFRNNQQEQDLMNIKKETIQDNQQRDQSLIIILDEISQKSKISDQPPGSTLQSQSAEASSIRNAQSMHWPHKQPLQGNLQHQKKPNFRKQRRSRKKIQQFPRISKDSQESKQFANLFEQIGNDLKDYKENEKQWAQRKHDSY